MDPTARSSSVYRLILLRMTALREDGLLTEMNAPTEYNASDGDRMFKCPREKMGTFNLNHKPNRQQATSEQTLLWRRQPQLVPLSRALNLDSETVFICFGITVMNCQKLDNFL